jgi:hypothetical protein
MKLAWASNSLLAPAGVSKLADGDHLKGTLSGIGTMELKVAAES